MKGRILIVDDDQDVLYTARLILKEHFTSVDTISNPADIIPILNKEHFDVVLLDMNFVQGATSGKEGLDLLEKILKAKPNTKIIMNTAYGDIDLAVTAMKNGAIDFLVKPWEKEKLISTVSAICKLSQSEQEVSHLKSKQKELLKDTNNHYVEIVSKAQSMEPILETIEKVANTDADVLLLGENGTGKEIVARDIHRRSSRAQEAFIKVDLGSITETLFESELFGHKKGAFTDAKEDRPGRFEIATGGTLFLDEIGNLTMPLQAKLLSALQNRQITRVGASEPVPVDIRLICATNKPIYSMVDEGEFRQDLLYRMNTVELRLPPLRQRQEDISLLTDHFLKAYASKYQKGSLRMQNGVLKKLESYRWPGNIRELQHAVERAVIMSDGKELKSADFLLTPKKTTSAPSSSLKIEDREKEAIEHALESCHGNLTKAAVELGWGRSTLYRKMKKYGL